MSRNRLSRKAFTLIELLGVVLIIALLVGLSLRVATYVGERARISQTKALLAQLELGIEAFKLDKGYYPTSTVYRLADHIDLIQTNSWLLYQQLSGGNYMGFTSGQLTAYGGIKYIKDAWGKPICYYCSKAASSSGTFSTGDYAAQTFHYVIGGQVNTVTFDLFSFGTDGGTYVPGSGFSLWNSPSSTIDDIWSGR